VLKGVAPANAYPCADGSDVLIAGNADTVFRRLSAAMAPDHDSAELVDDPRFGDHGSRGANAQELDQLVAQWTVTYHSDDLLALLTQHGVPAGRVYTAPDMLADEHYAARDMIVRRTARAGFEVPMTGIVPRFSRTPGSVRDVGPSLGEHTEGLRSEMDRPP
jgi:crotonobetainyl-CoA:carnitine CoA-transferase CaiB-like acyl-CoA transferase